MAPDAAGIRASIDVSAPDLEKLDASIARFRESIRTSSLTMTSVNDAGYYAKLAEEVERGWRQAGYHFGAFAVGFLKMMEPQYAWDAISRNLERRIWRGESLETAHALSAGAYCISSGSEVYPIIQSFPAPAYQVIEATFALSRWDGWGGGSIAKTFADHPIQPPAQKREFDAESRRMMNRIIIGRGGRKRSNPMGRKK